MDPVEVELLVFGSSTPAGEGWCSLRPRHGGCKRQLSAVPLLATGHGSAEVVFGMAGDAGLGQADE